MYASLVKKEACIGMAEPKAPKQSAAPATSEAKGVSRREFLMYAWGISLGVLTVGTGIATVAFALPRFKEGEFGGAFTIDPATLPPVNSPPQPNTAGKYWLAHLETGILAHYRVCTHLGCLYEWDNLNFRFQCPCHGSRFWFDGELMRGPGRARAGRIRHPGAGCERQRAGRNERARGSRSCTAGHGEDHHRYGQAGHPLWRCTDSAR